MVYAQLILHNRVGFIAHVYPQYRSIEAFESFGQYTQGNS